MNIAISKRPFQAGPHCGDQSEYWSKKKKTSLCMVDGLGHGEYAEKAAKAAVEWVTSHYAEASLDELFSGCNKSIRNTRGVAMGIAVIDEKTGLLTFAGVGNTRIMIVRKDPRVEPQKKIVRLTSSYGIVGGGYKRLLIESATLQTNDLVIMYTDGVAEIFDLSDYNGRFLAEPEQLAERIIADWGRETDDAAVLVYKKEVQQ